MENNNKKVNQLPDEYWVQNPHPGLADTEFAELLLKLTSDNLACTATYYKIQGNRYRDAVETRPSQGGLPILSFDEWKAGLESLPRFTKFREGDWVTCITEPLLKDVDAGQGWKYGKTFRIAVDSTRVSFGKERHCLFPGPVSEGNGVFSEFVRLATTAEIDEILLPHKYKVGDWVVWQAGENKKAYKIATLKNYTDWSVWHNDNQSSYTVDIHTTVRPATSAEIQNSGGKVGVDWIPLPASSQDIPIGWKVGDRMVHYQATTEPGWIIKHSSSGYYVEFMSDGSRGGGYTLKQLNDFVSKGTWLHYAEKPVSHEMWKVGDLLPREWLATQLTYTTDGKLHMSGFKSTSDRIVKDVDENGRAHISDTITVWLQPKDQCAPVPSHALSDEWKVGDVLPIKWLNIEAFKSVYIDRGDGFEPFAAGSFASPERTVKEVRNRWAKISGTSSLWLPPKNQCIPIISSSLSLAPEIVTSANVYQGMKVTRGKDWNYGNQDGGEGNVGIVGPNLGIAGQRDVTWPNGTVARYSISGKYDLYLSKGTQVKSSNNQFQSSINNQNQTENVRQRHSSGSTADTGTRPEQIIVSGDPEEPAFQRGKRLTGTAGQSGEQLLTVVRGHKGYGSVLKECEEGSY